MTGKSWNDLCKHWKEKWDVYDSEVHSDDSNGIDIYEVTETINQNIIEDDIFLTDAGSPSYVCPVVVKSKSTNQFIISPSQGDMGWTIPASVGVALNAPNKNVIVIVGDGSFYSNVQELAVIKEHNLPVRVFVLNNDGYMSIRNTQTKYYEGRVYGVDASSGISFPPLSKIADAFGFDYHKVSNRNELRAQCDQLMHDKRPAIVEIMCKKEQEILPAQAFKILADGSRVQAPLHDMLPFMTQEEMDEEWPLTPR